MMRASLLRGLLATYAMVIDVDGLGCQPRITEAPNIARRQGVGSNLVGYLTTDGTSTTCAAGSILVLLSGTVPWLIVCYSMYLFTDIEDQSPHSAFACNAAASQLSFYDTTPTTAATTSQTSALLTSSESLLTSPLETTVTVTTTVSTSSSSTTTTASSTSKENKAWTAGLIIGGAAGIAIIVALPFWV